MMARPDKAILAGGMAELSEARNKLKEQAA
jgi:hypothetical protein